MTEQENNGCCYRNLNVSIRGLRVPLSREEIISSPYAGNRAEGRKARALSWRIKEYEMALQDAGPSLGTSAMELAYTSVSERLHKAEQDYQQLVAKRS